MLQERYFAAMRGILGQIEATQKEAVDRCARMVVDSLLADGAFHVLDTGHMLMFEAVGRSGGLIAVRPVNAAVTVDNPVRKRERATAKPKRYLDSIPGLPEYIFDKSEIVAGDVLLIGSVSGINILPVEMALEARKRDVRTIGLTSVAYSAALASKHSSGKRLFEAVDEVLDHCAPVGDTLVEVEQLGLGICPASGVGAAYLNWALQAQIVEQMLAHGVEPDVYLSNHLAAAGAHNAEALARYEKLGY
jgi:uncharacterized phosphosugar-binding protein